MNNSIKANRLFINAAEALESPEKLWGEDIFKMPAEEMKPYMQNLLQAMTSKDRIKAIDLLDPDNFDFSAAIASATKSKSPAILTDFKKLCEELNNPVQYYDSKLFNLSAAKIRAELNALLKQMTSEDQNTAKALLDLETFEIAKALTKARNKKVDAEKPKGPRTQGFNTPTRPFARPRIVQYQR